MTAVILLVQRIDGIGHNRDTGNERQSWRRNWTRFTEVRQIAAASLGLSRPFVLGGYPVHQDDERSMVAYCLNGAPDRPVLRLDGDVLREVSPPDSHSGFDCS